MNIGARAHPVVATATPQTTVVEAARLMREHHVGALMVTEDAQTGAPLVGILTDRDLIVEVIGVGLDPNLILVGDVMSSRVVVAHDGDDIFDAVRLMRSKGVRRLPVLDRESHLVGILSMDDLLDILVDELGGMVKTISKGEAREARTRPAPSDLAAAQNLRSASAGR